MVQLLHPYMTTGKTTALTRWTFVGKLMSLLFNMLSRLVMDFPGGSDSKASVYDVGDLGSIPVLGRSPGEGNGNPLQYYCLVGYSPWGFSRQEDWSGLPCSPPGDLPNPGIEPTALNGSCIGWWIPYQ